MDSLTKDNQSCLYAIFVITYPKGMNEQNCKFWMLMVFLTSWDCPILMILHKKFQ